MDAEINIRSLKRARGELLNWSKGESGISILSSYETCAYSRFHTRIKS